MSDKTSKEDDLTEAAGEVASMLDRFGAKELGDGLRLGASLFGKTTKAAKALESAYASSATKRVVDRVVHEAEAHGARSPLRHVGKKRKRVIVVEEIDDEREDKRR